MGHPKRKLVFQPSIFRGYISFREGSFSGPKNPINATSFLPENYLETFRDSEAHRPPGKKFKRGNRGIWGRWDPWWFLQYAVDEFRNSANSPVEVGSWNPIIAHDLHVFFTFQMVQDFSHQQAKKEVRKTLQCSFHMFCLWKENAMSLSYTKLKNETLEKKTHIMSKGNKHQEEPQTTQYIIPNILS